LVNWSIKMARSNYTKLYVGEDYNSAPETESDIECKVFRNTPITTVQRDALTAEAGMEIYNSDSNQFEFYNGTVWGAS